MLHRPILWSFILLVSLVTVGFAAGVDPELDVTSEEPEETTTPEVTPEDIGLAPDGTAPMILTNQDGEPLSDQYQVVSDGVNEKFRIAEDATNVSITEHSVAYNTAALESAGVPVAGAPDIQWTLTDAQGKTMGRR